MRNGAVADSDRPRFQFSYASLLLRSSFRNLDADRARLRLSLEPSASTTLSSITIARA